MIYILDTDHLTILQKGDGVEYDNLTLRINAANPHNVASSVISYHEQVMGANLYISRHKDDAGLARGYALLSQTLSTFSKWRMIPFEQAAITEFQRLRHLGVRIATKDLRIASITLASNGILLTRNFSDFRQVPGLRIEDWTKPPGP